MKQGLEEVAVAHRVEGLEILGDLADGGPQGMDGEESGQNGHHGNFCLSQVKPRGGGLGGADDSRPHLGVGSGCSCKGVVSFPSIVHGHG